MPAVPHGPAQKCVHRGVPPALVTVGEPGAPDLARDIDQTHRDPVEQRSGRDGQDLTQRGLPGQQEVDSPALILQRAAHPQLGRPVAPATVGTLRYADLVEVVHGDAAVEAVWELLELDPVTPHGVEFGVPDVDASLLRAIHEGVDQRAQCGLRQ